MYDRTVRRRRAVLAGCVALSLILLTAYFGEGAGGTLHSVQRGALAVLAPVQEGASRALKPVRDGFGWVGDSIHAKSQRDALRTRNQALEAQVTRQQLQVSQLSQVKGIEDLNAASGLEGQRPVMARVISQTPSLFYSQITVDKGSSEGIAVNQPVTGGGGLVGRVSEVVRNASVITLITDEDFAVSARTLRRNVPGTVRPAIGSPGDLVLEFVSQAQSVEEGERIVTAGTSSERLKSLFPPGIPIGRVRDIQDGAGDLDRVIHVKPAADMTNLQFVSVLTAPATGAVTAAATP